MGNNGLVSSQVLRGRGPPAPGGFRDSLLSPLSSPQDYGPRVASTARRHGFMKWSGGNGLSSGLRLGQQTRMLGGHMHASPTPLHPLALCTVAVALTGRWGTMRWGLLHKPVARVDDTAPDTRVLSRQRRIGLLRLICSEHSLGACAKDLQLKVSDDALIQMAPRRSARVARPCMRVSSKTMQRAAGMHCEQKRWEASDGVRRK